MHRLLNRKLKNMFIFYLFVLFVLFVDHQVLCYLLIICEPVPSWSKSAIEYQQTLTISLYSAHFVHCNY